MSADQSFASTGARRRHTRKIPLTVLVAGNSGTGKTALVDALAGHRVNDKSKRTRETTAYSSGKSNELKITQHTLNTDLSEFNTTILDVHNFGYFADSMVDIERLTQYLEDKFDEMVSEQSRIRRNPRFVDRRVHACIYLVQAPHGLNEVDITAMTRLSTLTAIIPVIGRAESLTQDELKAMKRKIREDCKHYKIPTFEFDKDIQVELPMHIIRTNEYSDKGEALLSLNLAYGRVDATDPAISDFNALRCAVLNNYAFDLIDHTVDILYEQYRTIRLSDPTARYSVLEPEILAGHATRLKQEMLDRESRELKEQEERVQRELEQRRIEIAERERELRRIEERLAAEKAAAEKAREQEERKAAQQAKEAKEAAERQQRVEELAQHNTLLEVERNGASQHSFQGHQVFNENDETEQEPLKKSKNEHESAQSFKHERNLEQYHEPQHEHSVSKIPTQPRDSMTLESSPIAKSHGNPSVLVSQASGRPAPPTSAPPTVPSSVPPPSSQPQSKELGTSNSASSVSSADAEISALPAGTHQSYVSLDSSDYGDGSFVSVRPIKVAGSSITGTGSKAPTAPPPPVPPVPASINTGSAKTGPVVDFSAPGTQSVKPLSSSAKTGPIIEPTSSTRSNWGSVNSHKGTRYDTYGDAPKSNGSSVYSSAPLETTATLKAQGSAKTGPVITYQSPKQQKQQQQHYATQGAVAATGNQTANSGPSSPESAASSPSSPRIGGRTRLSSLSAAASAAATAAAASVSSRLKPKSNSATSSPRPDASPRANQQAFTTPKLQQSTPDSPQVMVNSPGNPALAPKKSFVASPKVRQASSFASLRETPPGTPPLGRAPQRPGSGELRPQLDNRTPSFVSAESTTAPLALDTMPGAFPRKSSQNRESSTTTSLSSLSMVSAEGNANGQLEKLGTPSASESSADNKHSSPSLPPRSPNRPPSFVSLGSTLSRNRPTAPSERVGASNSGNKSPYIPSIPKIPASPK